MGGRDARRRVLPGSPSFYRFEWIVLAVGAALAAFGALLILSAAAGWPFTS